MKTLKQIFDNIFGDMKFDDDHQYVLEVNIKGLTDEEADELNERIMGVVNEYLDNKGETYNWHTEVTED